MPVSRDARVGVIIVAGGSGLRLGFGVPKAQVQCAGVSILERALRGTLAARIAVELCVVVPAGDTFLRSVVAQALRTGAGSASDAYGVTVTTVDGGALRSESVRAGLAALSGNLDYILVHDAARALTPPPVFRRVVDRLAEGPRAVVPAIEVVDTIKSVNEGRVTGTPERSSLRAVQTPQGFHADVLRAAHASRATGEVTDDAMVVESLGIPVHIVEGSAAAFKITTPQDLMLAEALIHAAGADSRKVDQ